jgi:hypothetical protein
LFFEPYMRIGILAGSPYGTCENDAFSQVSLKPPARFSHCANGTPARTTELQKKIEYLANEKDLDHEKIINPPFMFLVQINSHKHGA